MAGSATSTSGADLLRAVLTAGGDPADMPFWQGCGQGQFLLHRCEICNKCYWPASRCTGHGASAMAWVAASGRATLYTYTIMHRAYQPALQAQVPFIVGVVQLAEGPFYHTNIVECAHDQLAIGMALKVKMAAHESGLTLPMFVPDN